MRRLLSVKGALAVWTAVVIVFLFTPIVFLVLSSFNDFTSIFRFTKWSTRWGGR